MRGQYLNTGYYLPNPGLLFPRTEVQLESSTTEYIRMLRLKGILPVSLLWVTGSMVYAWFPACFLHKVDPLDRNISANPIHFPYLLAVAAAAEVKENSDDSVVRHRCLCWKGS